MYVKGFTIDAEATRDIDDAIWVDRDSRGSTVTVCIANVALAIAKDSTFDATAQRRAETAYHPGGRSTPMIPRRFSEGSCSLFEGESRSVMAIRIRLDHMLVPQGLPQIDSSILVSQKKLTYLDVRSILDDDKSELHEEVKNAALLSSALCDKRRQRDSFALIHPFVGWIMSETGHVRKVPRAELVGREIVQEMMILANSELARFCIEKEIPVPFRNHTARSSAPSRGELVSWMSASLQDCQTDEDIKRAQRGYLMVMNKAKYGASLLGHYGLDLPAYLHGTSPIRRYADLIVQRQILGYVNGGNLPYTKGEVDDICQIINATIDERATKKSDSFIAHANKRAERSIVSGKLEDLIPKTFERVLKVSLGGKFEQSVEDELMRRIESGNAAIIYYYQALFKSGTQWAETRRKVLRHLVYNPNLATSVVTLAQQMSGWGEPEFNVKRTGENESIVHIATVSIGGTLEPESIRTEPVRAPSLKRAKQMATVEALADFIGEPRPNWHVAVDCVLSEKPKVNKVPKKGTVNPVGELMEYCQFHSLDLPEYEFVRDGGTDHKPEFVVSCKAGDVHVKSHPMTTKKLAKKAAAERAIKLIIERS